jgi:protease II
MTEAVRDLGFIAWHDMYAAIEDVSGNAHKSAVKTQKDLYDQAQTLIAQSQKNTWSKLYEALPQEDSSYYSFRWSGHTIHVGAAKSSGQKLKIDTMGGPVKQIVAAGDFGTTASTFWCIQDLSDQKQQLSLITYSTKLRKIHTIKNVGETAVSKDKDMYFLRAENVFWYNKVYVLRDEKELLIYTEPVEKYVLSLLKPKNQNDIFVMRVSAIYQDIGIIENDTVMWLKTGFGTKSPLSKNIFTFDTYLEIDNVKFPYPDHRFFVEAQHVGGIVYVVLCKDTTSALYKYNKRSWNQVIKPIVGDISFCKYSDDIIVGVPHAPDRILRLNSHHIPVVMKEVAGPRYSIVCDESPLPWFAVIPTQKPIGIVICGYGSYGMSMRRTQQRQWMPWLKQKYMIATVCVRGGRENGDAWWNASRGPQRRKYGLRDFIVGVKHIQARFGFDKTNTVIYGRSAGGFLVTAATEILLQNIAVVLAEKPYTDVLRTVTNGHVLQTIQETDEFGYITDSAADFQAIMEISPYENITTNPTRNPAVILTAGVNDPAVPAAMPIRYATKAQALGWRNVVCRIESEGHFEKDSSGQAQDAALCDYYVKNRSI